MTIQQLHSHTAMSSSALNRRAADWNYLLGSNDGEVQQVGEADYILPALWTEDGPPAAAAAAAAASLSASI
jgi:hypothetical protein